MEHCIYQIGCRFGYRAFIDVETKKVLVIDYDTPHQSGITAYSPDGMTEPPEVETILKACVPEIYERVRNIQNGSEDGYHRHRIKIENGKLTFI